MGSFDFLHSTGNVIGDLGFLKRKARQDNSKQRKIRKQLAKNWPGIHIQQGKKMVLYPHALFFILTIFTLGYKK